MKLMQSICCLFSSRCASEACEANTAPQNSPRPATREPKNSDPGSSTD